MLLLVIFSFILFSSTSSPSTHLYPREFTILFIDMKWVLLVLFLLNQEISVVNQDGCIEPGLINTITLNIINRDRGPEKAI